MKILFIKVIVLVNYIIKCYEMIVCYKYKAINKFDIFIFEYKYIIWKLKENEKNLEVEFIYFQDIKL